MQHDEFMRRTSCKLSFGTEQPAKYFFDVTDRYFFFDTVYLKAQETSAGRDTVACIVKFKPDKTRLVSLLFIGSFIGALNALYGFIHIGNAKIRYLLTKACKLFTGMAQFSCIVIEITPSCKVG